MVSFTDASSCAARTFLTEKLDEYRVKRGVNGVPRIRHASQPSNSLESLWVDRRPIPDPAVQTWW